MEKSKTKSVENVFNSIYTFMFIVLLGVVFWALNIGHIFTIICALYCFFCFLFNVLHFALFPPLIIAFFLNSFTDSSQYFFYGISIVIFLIGAFVFIKNNIRKNNNLTKGKMFIPFIFLSSALFIGGIFSEHFNIIASLSMFCLCWIAYLFYFFMLNFVENLKDKLSYFFIIVGVQIFAQLILLHISSGNFWNSILSKTIIEIGVQNVNVAAVYILFSMLSVFYLATKNKNYDYLFCLSAVGFFIINFVLYSRICTLVSLILLISGLIYIFVKSQNKKIFLIILSCFLSLAIITLVLFFNVIMDFAKTYISMGVSLNGRSQLWSWCFKKFLQNPIFGIGIISKEPVPAVSFPIFVLAHNTVLQYLTSTGIIGAMLASVFYIFKYKTIFQKNKLHDFYGIIGIIMIAIVGIVDQSPTMDIFIFIICCLFISICEKTSTIEKNATDSKNEPVADENKQ